MAHTPEEYKDLLLKLLPPGAAFPREPGTNLERLLLGCAPEFTRTEARAEALAIDVNPLDTTELLPDWERAAGLPDRCSGELEETIQGRRNVLTAKLASVGGQSRAYFIEVARQLGYEITISEARPFRAGISAAGDALTNTADWIYTWRVNARETTEIYFRAGLSAAGEPLRSWGNSALECKINQLKPAHTNVLFSYGAVEADALYLDADRMYFFSNYTLPQLLEY